MFFIKFCKCFIFENFAYSELLGFYDGERGGVAFAEDKVSK